MDRISFFRGYTVHVVVLYAILESGVYGYSLTQSIHIVLQTTHGMAILLYSLVVDVATYKMCCWMRRCRIRRRRRFVQQTPLQYVYKFMCLCVYVSVYEWTLNTIKYLCKKKQQPLIIIINVVAIRLLDCRCSNIVDCTEYARGAACEYVRVHEFVALAGCLPAWLCIILCILACLEIKCCSMI